MRLLLVCTTAKRSVACIGTPHWRGRSTSAGPSIGSMTASERPRRGGRSGLQELTIDLLDLIYHSIGEALDSEVDLSSTRQFHLTLRACQSMIARP